MASSQARRSGAPRRADDCVRSRTGSPRPGGLSVHLHGFHTPSKDDGQPGGLTARQPRSLSCELADAGRERVRQRPAHPAGRRRRYRYPFTEAGAAERGATLWYHDHRLDVTARNNWRGLQGMGSPRTRREGPAAAHGEREIPLVIGDHAFDHMNRLTDPFGELAGAPNDGTTGRFVLVNGADRPHSRSRRRR